jgi:ABC-type transporter Mla MlaB component
MPKKTLHDSAHVFSVIVEGERWVCSGNLVFDTARHALECSRALALPASGEIDCAQIGPSDSTSVAFFLALKRRAVAEQRTITFIHTPPAQLDLAALYGVAELLFPQ